MNAHGRAQPRQRASRRKRAGRHPRRRMTPPRGPTIWKPAISSIAPEQAYQLALDAHAVGGEDPDLVGGIGGLERDRGATPAETLEGRFLLVDERDHDIARIRSVGLLEQGDVAVENAGLDHAVPAHLERE